MKILEKTYKAYLKFQVSGKKKNKNNDESICQDGSLADTCEDNLAEIEDIMDVPEHSEVTKMQLVDKGQEENMHIVEDMVG